MATVKINDDAIWLKNIEGSSRLQEKIKALRPGEALDLEIDGIVGKWERMRDGADGRPTLGIKPIAEMREVWAMRRGRIVRVREVVAADSYLAALTPTLNEWDSPEDDEAYGDL
jgi:hypothetical protein